MGRPNRIQFAGACYHIILQGNNRQDIFLSNQDRRYFLTLLKAYKDRHGLKVYAYCLLPNYVHLFLETLRPNLSKVMQGFNTAYTKYFNQRHGTSGHVFQGRYRAVVVDKEACLLELTRHIHLAPLREGMKEKPWRYPWSSCPAYVEAETREPLVDSAPVLKGLGENRFKQSVRYLHSIKEKTKDGDIQSPEVRGIFMGSDSFAAQVRKLCGKAAAMDSAVPRPTAEAILQEITAKHGMDTEQLFGRIQWRQVATVRKEAIYRTWKEARLGVTEISRMFNRTPSAVSQLIRAVETSRISGN